MAHATKNVGYGWQNIYVYKYYLSVYIAATESSAAIPSGYLVFYTWGVLPNCHFLAYKRCPIINGCVQILEGNIYYQLYYPTVLWYSNACEQCRTVHMVFLGLSLSVLPQTIKYTISMWAQFCHAANVRCIIYILLNIIFVVIYNIAAILHF